MLTLKAYENGTSEKNFFETIEIPIVGGAKEIEICTKGSWYNFNVGDEIRYESASSNYRSERLRVIGFNMLYGGMFACDIIYEEEYVHVTDPIGIVLLRRDGKDFSVGKTPIIGIWGKVTNKVGRVVALNPERPKSPEYLVKFRSDFEDGHDGKFDWKKAWYPRQYKKEGVKNLYWCLHEQIKFLR